MSKQDNQADSVSLPKQRARANMSYLTKWLQRIRSITILLPGRLPGLRAIGLVFSELHAAFSDMKIELETAVADEDSIAFAYTLTGTHTGPYLGIPGTGKSVKVRGMQLSKFKDGKMVERWGSSDQLGILQQIGVTELPKV